MLRSGFPLRFYPDATIGVFATLQLAVVLEGVAGGGDSWFKERRAKVGKIFLSFCLDTKRNKKIRQNNASARSAPA